MKQVLITTMLFLSFALNGQNYLPKWSDTYKTEKGMFVGMPQLIGMIDDNYYVLSPGKKEVNLLTYDTNHQLISDKPFYKKKGMFENYFFGKMLITQNGNFATFGYFEMKKGETELITYKIEDGQFSDKLELYKYNTKSLQSTHSTSMARSGKTAGGLGDIIVSKDKKSVCFATIVPNSSSDNSNEIEVTIYDADLKEVWSKVEKLKGADQLLSVKHLAVSNGGVTYILAEFENESSKSRKKGMPKTDFKLLQITKDSYKALDLNLEGDKLPKDVSLSLLNEEQGTFMISGLYVDATSKKGSKGFFTKKGNEAGFEPGKFHIFESAFLEDLSYSKDFRKNPELNDEYSIAKSIQFEDNSIGFIIERVKYTAPQSEVMIRDGSTNLVRPRLSAQIPAFRGGNLVVIKVDEEGNLLGKTKILRRWEANTRQELSFTSGIHNNKLYLIFGDLEKKPKLALADFAIIDEKGMLEHRETLLNAKKQRQVYNNRLTTFKDGRFLVSKVELPKLDRYAFGFIDLKK